MSFGPPRVDIEQTFHLHALFSASYGTATVSDAKVKAVFLLLTSTRQTV